MKSGTGQFLYDPLRFREWDPSILARDGLAELMGRAAVAPLTFMFLVPSGMRLVSGFRDEPDGSESSGGSE